MFHVVSDGAAQDPRGPGVPSRGGASRRPYTGLGTTLESSPSRLPTRGDASLSGQPGQQDRVVDAGLTPDMHDRELAGAQEPGKRLRADPQPPLRFGEGDQLRRRGDLQGEVLLPRGRARSGAWASGRRWPWPGFPSHSPECATRGTATALQTRTVQAETGATAPRIYANILIII